ncbi:Cytochrome P450 [Mycena indigotica]|uniref:Cytochrome P450 n=1 Tax=Mycena indigotica TaxID=2126181 RepID=A0A8H6SDK9_9AGAR|nr:Cytochrome P450 [Mycena indigotica]KAF7297469.1 Cytochrome P450 [Mycena indigotica]
MLELFPTASALAALALAIVYAAVNMKPRDGGIATLPGPMSSSWLYGNMRELLLSTQYGAFEFAWQKTFGPVYRVKACFGRQRVLLADPQAMAHVLSSPDFEHTPTFEHTTALVEGVLSLSYVQGGQHERIRGAMGPGFTPEAVQGYKPALDHVASDLVDALRKLSTVDSSLGADVCPSLSTATLGAVCRGVLGISVQDLGPDLLRTMAEMSAFASKTSPAKLLSDALASPALLPLTSRLPKPPFSILRRLRQLSTALGQRVVVSQVNGQGAAVRSNLNVVGSIVSVQSFGEQLSLDELAGQTGRFLIAGTQSATNAMSFALFELACDPDLQRRIRTELRDGNEDDAPLLTSLIKEILRFYPGVAISERIALRNTTIPIPDSASQIPNTTRPLNIKRGEAVFIATSSYHRNVAVWGDDADQFKPARWMDVDHAARPLMYGPYANLSTFLTGPRTCLGWRFLLLELHTLLAAVVRNFELRLPDGESRDAVGMKLTGTLGPVWVESGKKEVYLVVKELMSGTE